MADVKSEASENLPLPEKRKPEQECLDKEDDRKKKKSEISDNCPAIIDEKLCQKDSSADADVNVEADLDTGEGEVNDDNEEVDGDEEDDEDEDEDEDDDDDDDDESEEEEEEDGEHSAGRALVDKKGKGIMKEDKRKGSDDSSDGADLSDDDSDLSEDPLAEVDLDNILPSRTRRRVNQPGPYIVNDLDDDDDSEDSDA